jgi:signal transduction histidine kinase/DNA-binding response OmpR family regulator
MNMEMEIETMLHDDITLELKSVKDDTEQQIKDIQSFIDRKVNMLIVAPNQSEPLTDVIARAYNAGIHVILVDRKISSDNYTAYIGADNRLIGRNAGLFIAQMLGGKGKIAVIRGLEGTSSDNDRYDGFREVADMYPDMKIVAVAYGAYLKDVAEQRMNAILSSPAGDSIDVVYALNDRMATGAWNAAERRGLTSKMSFIGIDALPGTGNGIEQVIEGKLKASFIYPTAGDKIIQLAVKILHGEQYDRNNILQTNVVDETNARVLKLQTDAIIEQQSKLEWLRPQLRKYMSLYATQRHLMFGVMAVVLVFAVLLVMVYKAYKSKRRLNDELEHSNAELNNRKALIEEQYAQMVALSKQLEQATQAKLVFFTNISHEFRTPLTLIAGPVNSLLSDKKTTGEQRRLLTLVRKNVSVLLKLIDQIIDFRKYENGKLTFTPAVCDLRQQLTEWNEPFIEMAENQHLQFAFNVLSESSFRMMIDAAKMERIYFNLLSNAVKFASKNGSILVELDRTTDSGDGASYAILRVSNTGKGISDENVKHIFDRFYQVDSHVAGSGIGLALVKAMVELHGGDITVNSRADGWTLFTVRIPFVEAGSEEVACEPAITATTIEDLEKTGPCVVDDFTDTPGEQPCTVLVVDDNRDIRTFIKIMLQDKDYRIIEAADGDEGYRKAVRYVPDIVVCDVMMPGTDGAELCRRLKTELPTSHIPVILLTSATLDEQRIAGYEHGADDYIAKPFNSDVLEARIANLIANRKRLRELFGANMLNDNISGAVGASNDVDDKFLMRLKELISANLSDSNFSIEELGQQMGLSHTQLYRKVKSLLNCVPVELLRIMRLKRARQMLVTIGANVAEVAYSVGFTSPSYFTKCFKDYYNESPTEVVKKMR